MGRRSASPGTGRPAKVREEVSELASADRSFVPEAGAAGAGLAWRWPRPKIDRPGRKKPLLLTRSARPPGRVDGRPSVGRTLVDRA
jgi:hypothetical protein